MTISRGGGERRSAGSCMWLWPRSWSLWGIPSYAYLSRDDLVGQFQLCASATVIASLIANFRFQLLGSVAILHSDARWQLIIPVAEILAPVSSIGYVAAVPGFGLEILAQFSCVTPSSPSSFHTDVRGCPSSLFATFRLFDAPRSEKRLIPLLCRNLSAGCCLPVLYFCRRLGVLIRG